MASTAHEALTTAKFMLNAALRRGDNTVKARRELTEAEQAEARDRDAHDRLLAQMEQASAESVGQAVAAECAALRADILAECAAILPGFAPAIVIESHRLALLLEGRARHADMVAARDELDADLENLQARLADVEGQLAALHAKPERTDVENGTAHFLVLDQADIKALMTAAGAQKDTLQLPDLSGLERRWTKARADARHGALKLVMVELEGRLLATAHSVAADVGLADTQHRYVPSPEMRQAVSRSIV